MQSKNHSSIWSGAKFATSLTKMQNGNEWEETSGDQLEKWKLITNRLNILKCEINKYITWNMGCDDNVMCDVSCAAQYCDGCRMVNQSKKIHWPLIQLSHSKISQKPGKIQYKPYSNDACFSYVDLFDYQWMYHARPSHLIPLQHLAVHLVYDHVLALHPSVPAYSLQQISYLSIVMEPSPIPLSLYTSLSLPVPSPRQPQPDATVSCGGSALVSLCVRGQSADVPDPKPKFNSHTINSGFVFNAQCRSHRTQCTVGRYGDHPRSS